MAGGNSTYRLNFKVGADTSEAITQINKLNQTLNNIQSKPVSIFNPNEMSKAVSAAEDIQKALQNAIDPRTGAFDLSRFSLSLQDSKKSLSALRTELMSAGEEGQQAFLQLSTTIANAGLPTSRLLGLFKKLGNTVINTINWNITNGALRAITGTIKSAMGYAEDLNKSLNKIRIVTGKSADDMARFAKTATEAAQALSTTTKEYADASLIYYQQGLSDEEVKTRTDVTVKMANVTGESARQVSEHLTAVWNNFYDGSKSLEYYADVMTKLGATTASSTTEISEGLEKFAAIADTVGLSYEYAASALATVTATTRQSADIVGTAFKTLFARMESLKLGETLDDGTSLKQYSQALATVGVNIKDATGNLRDMDDILDDLGAKWSMISKDQQVALAQQIAGVRQYTQLMALMNNWDFMQQNLATANSSEGTLAQQQAIYEQSWEASADRVRAAWEDVYNFIANDDFFIGLNDLLSGTLIPAIEGLLKGLGGVKGLLLTIFGNILTRASKEVPGFLYSARREVEILVGLGDKRARQLQQENARVSQEAADEANRKGQYQLAGLLKGNVALSTAKGTAGLSRNEMAEYIHKANVKRTVLGRTGAALDQADVAQSKANAQIEQLKSKILEQQRKTYESIANHKQKDLDMTNKSRAAVAEQLQQLEAKRQKLDENDKNYQKQLNTINEAIDAERHKDEVLKEQAKHLQEELKLYNRLKVAGDAFTKARNAFNTIIPNLSAENQQKLNTGTTALGNISRYQGFIDSLGTAQFGTMNAQSKDVLIHEVQNIFDDILKEGMLNSGSAADTAIIGAIGRKLQTLNETLADDAASDADIQAAFESFVQYVTGQTVANLLNRGSDRAERMVREASQGAKSETVDELVEQTIAGSNTQGSVMGTAAGFGIPIGNPEQIPPHTQQTIEQVSQLTGSFMQLAGVASSVSTIMDGLSDGTLDASQAFTTLLSSSTSMIMTYNSLKKTFDDLSHSSAGFASVLGKIPGGATTASLAIMGITVVVMALVKAHEYAIKKITETAAKTRESIDIQTEETQKVRDLTDAYQALYQQKLQGQDVDDDLRAAAVELAESLDDEQAMIYALTGQYNELAAAARRAAKDQANLIMTNAGSTTTAGQMSLEQQIKHIGRSTLNYNGEEYTWSYNRDTASLNNDVKDALKDAGLLNGAGVLNFRSSATDTGALAQDIKEQYDEIYKQISEVINKTTDQKTRYALTEFQKNFAADFSKTYADSDFNTELTGYQQAQQQIAAAAIRSSEYSGRLESIKESGSIQDAQALIDEITEKYTVSADMVYTEIAKTMPEIADIVISARNLIEDGFTSSQSDAIKNVFEHAGANLAYADTDYMRLIGDVQGEAERAARQQERIDLQNQQAIAARGSSLAGADIDKKADFYQQNKDFLHDNNIKSMEEFLTMTDEDMKKFFADISETLRLNSEAAQEQYLQDLADKEAKYQEVIANFTSKYGTDTESMTDEQVEEYTSLTSKLAELQSLKQDAIDSAYLEHLENENAEVNRAADAYGVSADEIKKHTQYLANNADKLEDVDDELQDNYEASQKIAIAQARLNKGVKDLNSNWEDSYTTLKQTNKSSLQYSKALQTIQEDLANVFNIDQAEVFSEEFITQHRELIEQVSQGDMEAAAVLSQYVAQMLFDLSSATMEAEGINTTAISNMIADWQYLDTLPVGYNLTAQYADVCTALLTATASTREQIENMLTSLSIAYDYQYDSNGNPIGVTLRSTGPRAYSAPKITPKGGGGGKKSKPAKTKYSETDFERYKEITDKIDDVNRELKEMETIADRLYGASQLAAMEEENRILSEQAENYRKKRIEAEEYLNLDKERMLAYGKANGLDIKVENNRVVNYRELMEGLQAKKDAQMVKYNALGTEEAQSEYWETYIQPIVDKMDGLQTVIDQFDETYDVMRDMEEQERETVRKIQDNNYNMIQGKYTMNVKLIDNDKKFLETMKNLISDDIYGVAEKLLLTWNPDDSMNLAERSMAQMNDLATKKAELEAGYALWQEDNLAEGAISRDKFQEGMQEIFEDSLGLIENLHEIDEYFRTIERDTLEKFNDEWDYYLSLQERNTEFIEYVGKLIPLIYGKNNYKAMKQWFETQTEQAERLYETAQKKHAIAVQNLENIQKMYNEATAEEQKWLEDTLRAAQEEANQTAQEMEEAHLNVLEKKSDEIQNNINAAWQNFEEQVTNGLGFDFLKTSFGNLASIEDLLYTKTEQVYEVNKFLHELSKDMDKTDSIAAKNKIAAFAKETAAMKEQGELSKFELEVQKAKYNILLAQLALEDAANAKSIVRLHRDDEGNYGYIYSADPSKLDDAQQNLEDKQHDLYELVKNGTNRLAQALINEEQNFMQEVQKLQDIYGKDTAEYFEKLAILTDEHNHKMEILEGDYQLAVTELDQAGIDGRKEAVMLAHEDAVNASLDWRETETNTIEEVNTNLGILTDYMNTSVTEAIGTVGRALDETNTEAEELANYMTGEFANKMQENIDQVGDIVDAYEGWRKKLEEVEQQAKNAAKAAKEALEEVTKANNYQAPKVNRQTNDTAPGTVTTTGLGGGNGGEDGGNNGGYPGTVTDPDAWKSVILTSTMAEKFAINKLHMKDGQQVFYNFLNNWANKKTKGQLAQKYSTHEAFIKSLNTGGYTGNWSDPSLGKLAILHEKELVLNKDDTENMLAAVNIIRKVTSAIDMNTLSTLASLGTLGVPSYTASDQVLEQTVTITAEFPNATNHSEIEQAFNNLINRASQYAARR